MSSVTAVGDLEALKDLIAIPSYEPLPPDALAKVLSNPPFVPIRGSLNLRDCGACCPDYLKPGKVYRSGMPDFMPTESRRILRTELGITTMYDLRRNDELKTEVPSDDGGPAVISCPYMDGREMPKPSIMADFAPSEDGTRGIGYQKMYEDILEGYTTGYKRVFENLRDAEEDEAVLYHCTGEFSLPI